MWDVEFEDGSVVLRVYSRVYSRLIGIVFINFSFFYSFIIDIKELYFYIGFLILTVEWSFALLLLKLKRAWSFTFSS